MTPRLAAFAMLLLLHGAAEAHTRGASYSTWTLTDGGADAVARVSQLDLTRLGLDPQQTPDYATAAGRVIAQGLRMQAGDAACTPGAVSARLTADGGVRAAWSVACPQRDGRAIRSGLLFDVAPGHLHFARARWPDGSLRERVLTAAEPTLALPLTEPPGTLSRYVALGFGHILSGWDHLAFLLALLLLAGTLGEMALIATGFTLAHSLTLGASVLGLVQARLEQVEAVIGFTVALVAVENLWLRGGRERWMPVALVALLAAMALRLPPLLVGGLALFTACYFALLAQSTRPARLRMAMAMLFGLVHGFGFAGALGALQLPPERLALGLFGFNTGVELGQLLVIVLAWPALRWLGRNPRAHALANEGAAACLCALGVYGFVVRGFA